jgi:hypothetical protein
VRGGLDENLVAGGAGYLSSVLIPKLLDRSYTIDLVIEQLLAFTHRQGHLVVLNPLQG